MRNNDITTMKDEICEECVHYNLHPRDIWCGDCIHNGEKKKDNFKQKVIRPIMIFHD